MSDDFLNNDNNPINHDDNQIDHAGPDFSDTNINTDSSSPDSGSINNFNDSNAGTSHNGDSAYSFWAEQIAASSQGQSDPGYQSGQYNNLYDENRGSGQDSFNYGNNFGNPVFDTPPENNRKKKRRSFKFLKKTAKFILKAAVFGIVAGACFIGFNLAYYRINPDAAPIAINIGDGKSFGGFQLNLSPTSEEDKKIAATTVSSEAVEQKTAVTEVVDATMPSIVMITTTYTGSYDWFGQQVDQQQEGGGSGIIVGKNDKELLIATNNHVVEGADPIKVKFIDDTEAEAIIKGTDATADLAVLSIDLSTVKDSTLSAIKVAELGDSKSVKVGEMVIAIGNALGYGQSTTVGYISAKDRKVELEDKTMVLLQTDAAINPGNSGGALLNLEGEVIGINTVKYASSEVEGMGFAIPISRATPIINELMDREILENDEKGFLGVSIEDVTEDISNTYNWPVGVYVKSTVEGGSAEKAGIKAGDIITKVDDTEITAGTQLKEKITSYRVGTDVTITVMRSSDGKFVEKQIVVNLGKNPNVEEN